jgi:hypothetical protein
MFLLLPVSAFVLRVLMVGLTRRQAFGDTVVLTAGGG